MGSIIAVIIGILLIGGFAGVLRESEDGRVFLFASFMILVCSIFSEFIPFTEFIINICVLVIVYIIIKFGYNMIFKGPSEK